VQNSGIQVQSDKRIKGCVNTDSLHGGGGVGSFEEGIDTRRQHYARTSRCQHLGHLSQEGVVTAERIRWTLCTGDTCVMSRYRRQGKSHTAERWLIGKPSVVHSDHHLCRYSTKVEDGKL
jgi:hypothetical protein